jgi:hypothetical protein
MPFRSTTPNPVLVVMAAATLVGATLATSPAIASEPRITAEETGAIRSAMTTAGVSPSQQDELIAKLRSGAKTDSERPAAERRRSRRSVMVLNAPSRRCR